MTSAPLTDSRAPRKVLLVGATGEVGKRLITALTVDGYHVTGLHRSPDPADAVRDAGPRPSRATSPLTEPAIDDARRE